MEVTVEPQGMPKTMWADTQSRGKWVIFVSPLQAAMVENNFVQAEFAVCKELESAMALRGAQLHSGTGRSWPGWCSLCQSEDLLHQGPGKAPLCLLHLWLRPLPSRGWLKWRGKAHPQTAHQAVHCQRRLCGTLFQWRLLTTQSTVREHKLICLCCCPQGK